MKIRNWWMTRQWKKHKDSPHYRGKWELGAVHNGRWQRILDVEGEYWTLTEVGQVHYSEIQGLDHFGLFAGYI